MGLEEGQRPLVHHPGGGGTHLQEVEHARLGALEGAVEIFAGVDVAAVLPLHLHQAADGKAVGLAEVGAGAQDVEELVLLAQVGELLAQLGVHLHLGFLDDAVHLGDAFHQRVVLVKAFLGLDELGGQHGADAQRHLGGGHAVAPGVDPGDETGVVRLGTGVVGQGDHGRAPLIGQNRGVHRFLGVAGVAAHHHHAVLAQLLGGGHQELLGGVPAGGGLGAFHGHHEVGGIQVDQAAAAGHPVHLGDLAVLRQDLLDNFICFHDSLLLLQ